MKLKDHGSHLLRSDPVAKSLRKKKKKYLAILCYVDRVLSVSIAGKDFA